MFNLNPIAILKQRRVSTLPPHFAKTKIGEMVLFDNELIDWVDARLKGRYCVVRSPAIDKDGKLKSATFVAFEDQKELTYFMLACPHLRRT
jgi:hypothetical protein